MGTERSSEEGRGGAVYRRIRMNALMGFVLPAPLI